ncbi:MAG: glycine cleavage system protein H [Salinivirgaceae bacterium]|jgi:glycine cleavage system H lipoate-binding protein/ABC-type phosphate transport system substrate-binding protein|nr:glycine cleavage system protein H [Salinivirgaceae bacterium]
MKRTVVTVFALAFLISAVAISKDDAIPQKAIEGSLTVYCTNDVYGLSDDLTNVFCNLNPDIAINVNKITNSFNVETLKKSGVLAIASKNFDLSSKNNIEKVIIGRQIVVPIISSKNPFLSEIMQYGITVESLSQFLCNSDLSNSTTILANNQQIKLNYYATSEALINRKVGMFIKNNNSNISGISVENVDVLLEKIKNDPNGIGFCLFNDAVDVGNQRFTEGVKILPLDINNNGNLDYMEQIYNNPNSFLRGVWIGKYPHELTSNLYAFANFKNGSKEQKTFLNWMFFEGQKSLNKYGYHELVSNEIQSKLDKINGFNLKTEVASEKNANLKAIIILIGILLLIGIVLDFALFRWNRKVAKREGAYENQILYNENTVEAPLGLFFDKSHTWAFMEKNGQVRIGLSYFLPSITGTLTGVNLIKSGEIIKKGETLLSVIQQGKQINIKAPVSGTIQTVNQRLLSDASLINFSPYNEGWIYTIEPANWLREIQFLLMFDNFNRWLKTEYLRLKDFLAIVKTNEDLLQPAMVLQEGGEIRKSVLKDLDPKVWEDFQHYFIETI